MDIFALVAAFGGGMFGAAVGALPSFIMTGVLAIAGGVAVASGAPAVGNIAFGSFLGPHIAFAGGVAAAAYAANKKKILGAGPDILTPLYSLNDPSVLICGGIFGICGFLVHYLYTIILKLPTDQVAMTVFTLGIISRLALGSSGLVGKYQPENPNTPRVWFPTGTKLMQSIVLGLGVGCLVAGIVVSMQKAGVDAGFIGNFPVICFGISAFSLFFAQTGFGVPTTHHITLPAANAAVLSGSLAVGVVVAVICSLVGDFIGLTFNSHNDSHIDPPAGTIFLMTFLILAVWGK